MQRFRIDRPVLRFLNVVARRLQENHHHQRQRGVAGRLEPRGNIAFDANLSGVDQRCQPVGRRPRYVAQRLKTGHVHPDRTGIVGVFRLPLQLDGLTGKDAGLVMPVDDDFGLDLAEELLDRA